MSQTGAADRPESRPQAMDGAHNRGSPLDRDKDDWPGSLWTELWSERPGQPSYWLTRFLILRLLGLVYLIAFATLVDQGSGLLGEHGLLPVGAFLDEIATRHGSRWSAFLELPSVFWLGDGSSSQLVIVGWTGIVLAAIVMLGYANAVLLAALWFLHLSVVHVGQRWYAFGWETQLLETGFIAVFSCGLLDGRPFCGRPPPLLVMWAYRWLIVRIMLGAGLIKIRGDECWRDWTCLYHHYETQPIPNPLSAYLHHMPKWFHRLGVGFTHFVELIVPWFAFGPRTARHGAGCLMLLLQLMLIASGNLSYLNWLTIVPILACFDDGVLRHVLPKSIVARAEAARGQASSRGQRAAVAGLVIVVAVLSIQPVGNLLSRRQRMNTSFDRLHLVNTYGAFGSVGKERFEIVFEGTRAARLDERTIWHEIEFRCKPGDPVRRPCVVAPYHHRLDWLIWFAAMGAPSQAPWAVHLVARLLEGEPSVIDLLDESYSFADAPPTWVRARHYRYELARPGESMWWRRSLVGEWLPPLHREDRALAGFLAAFGWASPAAAAPDRGPTVEGGGDQLESTAGPRPLPP